MDKLQRFMFGSKEKEGFLKQFVVYALLICIGFIYLYPILYMFSSSLMNLDDLLDSSINWIPSSLNFANYQQAAASMDFWKSLGLSIVIVLFTILTKFALLYFTIKQQKSAKINSVIAPEIKAIQKKYEKRKDQQSQMAMSQELSDLYAKYGTSPTGGCLQLLIQFPIFLALYRVVTNVPAYIGAVKDQYMIVINSLKNSNLLSKYFGELTDTDKIIDVMSGHDSTTIADFNFSGMINELNNTAATEAYEKISEMNKLFVFDLSISPASAFATLGFIVFLIPVLACVSQYVTSFLSSANNNNSDMADNSTMNTLKTRVKTTAENVAAAYGATAKVTLIDGYPALINSDYVCAEMEKLAEELIGRDKMYYMPEPSLGADDFAFFTQMCDGLYMNVGTNDGKQEHVQNIHNEYYKPDEEAMKTGILMETVGALTLLEK